MLKHAWSKIQEIGVLNCIKGYWIHLKYKKIQKEFGFDSWHLSPFEWRKYIQDATKYMNQQSVQTELDMACGLGELSRHLNAPNRYGYDYFENVIKAAKKLDKSKKIIFKRGSFPDVRIANKIDYFTALNYMHGSDETKWKPLFAILLQNNDIQNIMVDTLPQAKDRFCLDFSKILPCEYQLVHQMGPYLAGRMIYVYRKRKLNMKIVIRMDDITPDMNWNHFERFRQLLEAHQIHPLIGVVPDHQDQKLHMEEKRDDFWEQMHALKESGWTIAMHGFHHVYTTKNGGVFPLNHYSEFAGVSYENQYRMLEEGKRILESHGIHTNIFMAPAHSYDQNTIKVLHELGFRYITDGFGKTPYRVGGMIFLPISVDKKSSLKQKEGITTFVVHANHMKESEFRFYEQMLEQKEHSVVSYDEIFSYPYVERGLPGRILERFLADGKHNMIKLMSILKK